MKKSILFLALVFAVFAVTLAQSFNSAELKMRPNQTIVRNWDNNKVISTYYDNNGYCFTCSNLIRFNGTYNPAGFSAHSFYSDPLPSNYIVTDMKIMGDTVFFCGKKRLQNNPFFLGIVGYFDLNTFEHGNFSPNIHEILDSIHLEKLAVYSVNGNKNVVAIGYDNTASHNSIMVELKNVTSSSPTCTIHNNFIAYERLDNVIYTGTTIVLVGATNTGGTSIPCIHILDNLTNLSSSTNYLSYYEFGAGNEANGKTSSIILWHGNIAITYVHYDNTTHSFSTRTRVIDTYTSTPQNTISQEFLIDSKDDPIEMTYSHLHGILTLLQPTDHTYTNNPQFIFLQPFNTIASYTANHTYFTHSNPYLSLDSYSPHNIVSVGEGRIYLQKVVNQNNSGCPFLDLKIVQQVSNLSTLQQSTRLNSNPLNLNPTSPFLNTTREILSTTCVSQ